MWPRSRAAPRTAGPRSDRLDDGPHFDRAVSSARDLPGDFDRVVEVLAFQQVVSAELLFALCEGAVRGGELAVSDPQGRGRRAGLECLPAQERSPLLDHLGVGAGLLHHLLAPGRAWPAVVFVWVG